ncbi:hypothetical protein TRFO_26969 [Tritrichomonas foetus]|uniref:Leucine Rich Repeat family protein n=1 Tax=Tritrichomonas foetus TaxID=1144522 RepID=A0A1J4K6E4_9EUKA|nr:hypothetical protein TRFO_26969 [Tritrichomonas foetus]|eukprot:OHT05284.1 hypothetical protein TRFO_26969 [Tritrichomonas foetus]
MPPRKSSSSKKQESTPMNAEFIQCCKVLGFQDDEFVLQITPFLNKSETHLRLVNLTINSNSGKLILRFMQRYQKLQQVTFYSCVFSDPSFYKQLSSEFNKCTANSISFDYIPEQRDNLLPLLMTPSLDILSLRGNQCITSYDFIAHQKRPFPPSLNTFFNTLCNSPIKVLNLYGCHLGDEGAITLAHSLYFNKNLQCLSLARNRIGDDGAIALSSALSRYVLDEQETAIVEKFKNDESKPKISDEGGVLIKKKKGQKSVPVKKHPPPRAAGKKGAQAHQITERLNNFDPSAQVKAIIFNKWNSCITLPDTNQKVIPGNTTISSLILDENNITEKGGKALMEMLNYNNRIVQFSIVNNDDLKQETICKLRRIIPQSY